VIALLEDRVTRTLYRFKFTSSIDITDVEDSLLLSVYATEGVHGTAKVRMDGEFHVDRERRSCVVDATTPVGQMIARVFTGFLVREFGEQSFEVERVTTHERAATFATRHHEVAASTNGRSVR